jgi:hypothetical protein
VHDRVVGDRFHRLEQGPSTLSTVISLTVIFA